MTKGNEMNTREEWLKGINDCYEFSQLARFIGVTAGAMMNNIMGTPLDLDLIANMVGTNRITVDLYMYEFEMNGFIQSYISNPLEEEKKLVYRPIFEYKRIDPARGRYTDELNHKLDIMYGEEVITSSSAHSIPTESTIQATE